MNSFSHLSPDHLAQLTKAPLYLGLLIAEADGHADHKELEWVEKVTLFRIKNAHHSLRDFYQLANTEVKTNLNLVKSQLPENQDEKMKFLSDKLAEMKPVLAELDESVRERLVESFQTMAVSIAEISGGLLNYFAHKPDEEKWLHLDMLTD